MQQLGTHRFVKHGIRSTKLAARKGKQTCKYVRQPKPNKVQDPTSSICYCPKCGTNLALVQKAFQLASSYLL
jgi:hypothetical protein